MGDLNWNHGSYEFYYTVLMLYAIFTDIHMSSNMMSQFCPWWPSVLFFFSHFL